MNVLQTVLLHWWEEWTIYIYPFYIWVDRERLSLMKVWLVEPYSLGEANPYDKGLALKASANFLWQSILLYSFLTTQVLCCGFNCLVALHFYKCYCLILQICCMFCMIWKIIYMWLCFFNLQKPSKITG